MSKNVNYPFKRLQKITKKNLSQKLKGEMILTKKFNGKNKNFT